MEGVKRYAPLLSLSFAIQIKFVTPPPRARDNDGKAWLTMPLPHCRLSQRCHLFSIVDFVRFIFFVLLLLLCSAAHGKSCERESERAKKLANTNSWAQSFQHALRSFVFKAKCKQTDVCVFVRATTTKHSWAGERVRERASNCEALWRALSRSCSLSQLSQFPPTHCQNALTYCAPFKLSAKWAPLSCYDNADNEPVWQPQLRIFI